MKKSDREWLEEGYDAWAYYVGDPCYVIDDARWGDFCDALFRHSPRRGEYFGMVDWVVEDGGILKEYQVEVWGSPGGDGCWGFKENSQRYLGAVGGCREVGVDAGLIAVVPRECCEEETDPAHMGILFDDYPELHTQDALPHVTINGINCDGYSECDECGECDYEDHMHYCDNCGSLFCYGCGCECEYCEECDTWKGHYNSNCDCCADCEKAPCECNPCPKCGWGHETQDEADECCADEEE